MNAGGGTLLEPESLGWDGDTLVRPRDAIGAIPTLATDTLRRLAEEGRVLGPAGSALQRDLHLRSIAPGLERPWREPGGS
jgi:hypothetical protein